MDKDRVVGRIRMITPLRNKYAIRALELQLTIEAGLISLTD